MVFKPCFGQNAIVCEDDGKTVKFHPVCPKCSEVFFNTKGSGYCGDGSGPARVGAFYCPKCNYTFTVTLFRG